METHPNRETAFHAMSRENAERKDKFSPFLGVETSSLKENANCPFCNVIKDKIIDENDLAFCVHDNYPVTFLHTLVIPKRHIASFFHLEASEIMACYQLLNNVRRQIEAQDQEVLAFNVGVNNGEIAGQTIFHCHIHLIPRRKGDVANPRGGVRHTIPGKGYYSLK